MFQRQIRIQQYWPHIFDIKIYKRIPKIIFLLVDSCNYVYGYGIILIENAKILDYITTAEIVKRQGNCCIQDILQSAFRE